MCGFAGKLQVRGRIEPATQELVARMTAEIAHRGPDDSGSFADERVALGFRRLSIIDLSGGHQPMARTSCFGDAAFHAWIAFNGEIYNYVELRDELRAAGHRFETSSDTEVILHLYEACGESFVERLRGMFAIALWDPRRGELYLARDRLGKKPLFYARTADGLLFASELKGLLVAPEVERKIDWRAFDALMSLRFIPGDGSIFEGIHSVPPAHVQVWRDGSVRARRYWRLAFEPKREMSEEQALGETEEMLREAVRLRLRSDVPLGAFLSGGVDSGAVLALACEQATDPPATYTVGVAERSWNELPLAAETARLHRAPHHAVMVSAEAVQELPRLLWHLDEPFADRYALATWVVARRAAADLKVVLTGDGGDEVFAGYDRYTGHRLLEYYRWLPRGLRREVVAPLLDALPLERSRWLRALHWANVLSLLPPPEAYARGLAHFRFQAEDKRELYGPSVLDALDHHDALAAVVEEFRSAAASDPLDRMMSTDSALRLPSYTLSRMDRITMAFGLEARAPILDHRLMELVARFPVAVKLAGGRRKYLLGKIAERRLPASVLKHRKRGFGLPVGEWLRGPLRAAARRFCSDGRLVERGVLHGEGVKGLVEEHLAGRRDHSERIWMILNVELWFRVVMEKRDPAELGRELGETLAGVGSPAP